MQSFDHIPPFNLTAPYIGRSYLSLGSNLGNREAYLRQAVALLSERAGKVVICSDYYYSKPWGFASANDFCNICLALDTPLSPIELLHCTQAIEREMGRTHKSEGGHYTDRIIDIDLLLYYTADGTSVPCATQELTLPHPLMQEREFVMKPLGEILHPEPNA